MITAADREALRAECKRLRWNPSRLSALAKILPMITVVRFKRDYSTHWEYEITYRGRRIQSRHFCKKQNQEKER